MSITLAPPSPTSAPAPTFTLDDIYLLSVEQYHQMIRPGLLLDGDPVELLEGLLVKKMTINAPHRGAVRKVWKALERMVPSGWYVDREAPVTLPASEPEPDVAVLRGETDDYPDRQPGPTETALIVEVADSSLSRDRGTKKRIYARAGIVIYWIVNLVDRQIEVYTEPTGPAETPDYQRQENYGAADSVPLVIDGREVGRLAVQEVLP